jgi:hypothetical protein
MWREVAMPMQLQEYERRMAEARARRIGRDIEDVLDEMDLPREGEGELNPRRCKLCKMVLGHTDDCPDITRPYGVPAWR